MKTPVLVCLQSTRDLLSAPERWARGWYAFDAVGVQVAPFDSYAVRWCLHGAVVKSAGEGHVHTRGVALNELADTLWAEGYRVGKETRTFTLYRFNDEFSRTHAEVLALIDKTIYRLEGDVAA